MAWRRRCSSGAQLGDYRRGHPLLRLDAGGLLLSLEVAQLLLGLASNRAVTKPLSANCPQHLGGQLPCMSGAERRSV